MEDLNRKVNLFMKPWKLMEKKIFLNVIMSIFFLQIKTGYKMLLWVF